MAEVNVCITVDLDPQAVLNCSLQKLGTAVRHGCIDLMGFAVAREISIRVSCNRQKLYRLILLINGHYNNNIRSVALSILAVALASAVDTDKKEILNRFILEHLI